MLLREWLCPTCWFAFAHPHVRAQRSSTNMSACTTKRVLCHHDSVDAQLTALDTAQSDAV